MRSTIFFCLLLFFNITNAQDLDKLRSYLDSNNTSINLLQPSQPDPFFAAVMKDKVLFVLGEGGSHQLALYNQLRVYLLYQFTQLNLKYFFIEFGRSTAFFDNNYLQKKAETTESSRQNEAYVQEMKQARQLYQNGYHFTYKGIDMESLRQLYNAIKTLSAGVNPTIIQATPFLRSVLIDTSYFHYNDNNYFINQEHFLKYYYKHWQEMFIEDSVSLKNILPVEQYAQLRYFLSNPQARSPYENRNPGMAKNLLNEIAPVDPGATYLLDLGMAHTLLNNNASVVHILQNSKLLKDKMVVMNTYCDNCRLLDKDISDPEIRFMKTEVLAVFRVAAKTALTIFDLSKLPPEFDDLKKYGELILFAQVQK